MIIKGIHQPKSLSLPLVSSPSPPAQIYPGLIQPETIESFLCLCKLSVYVITDPISVPSYFSGGIAVCLWSEGVTSSRRHYLWSERDVEVFWFGFVVVVGGFWFGLVWMEVFCAVLFVFLGRLSWLLAAKKRGKHSLGVGLSAWVMTQEVAGLGLVVKQLENCRSHWTNEMSKFLGVYTS